MVIVKKEDVRSGQPTVEGTRVTVGDVVERFYELGRGLGDIASDLGIEESQAEEALRYYHRQIVEEGGLGEKMFLSSAA